MSRLSTDEWLKINEEKANEVFQYILAGFTGNITGWEISRITLAATDDGDFRVSISARERSGKETGLWLIAFTNGGSPFEALCLVESAFRKGNIKWRIDQYRNDDRDGLPKSGITYKLAG